MLGSRTGITEKRRVSIPPTLQTSLVDTRRTFHDIPLPLPPLDMPALGHDAPEVVLAQRLARVPQHHDRSLLPSQRFGRQCPYPPVLAPG